MPGRKRREGQTGPGPIFIISGGTGASGEQLVRTALAQFSAVDVDVVVCAGIRRKSQIERAVARAAKAGGTIFHTLVDAEARRTLIREARQRDITAVDLIGHVLTRLESALRLHPVGRPGMYRQLHEEYLQRIEAMEFAVAHDDGCRPEEMHLAQIVLVGVSRSGKTPLSMCLAMRGWRVANVPLVPGVPPPTELEQFEPGKIVGLTIDRDQLSVLRGQRRRRLQVTGESAYDAADEIDRELASAERWFRGRGIPVIDVTSKPIEETASEVVGIIDRRG